MLPVLPKPGDGHAINTRTSVVCLNPFPCPLQIPRIIHLTDQRVSLVCPHGRSLPDPLRALAGFLSTGVSVIAAATISPLMPTYPLQHVVPIPGVTPSP